jgi:hypothetical protein
LYMFYRFYNSSSISLEDIKDAITVFLCIR